MFKIFNLLLLTVFVNGASLTFQEGEIQAKTEVFGDSNINPSSKNILSKLTMDNSIESIQGMVTMNSASLKSDNESRDKNMYELLQTKLYPYISFKFSDIKKEGAFYLVNGTLSLNGVSKQISSKAKIEDRSNSVDINGDFSIKLTDFDMEPPSLIFLSVRDQIDINYTLNYQKQ